MELSHQDKLALLEEHERLKRYNDGDGQSVGSDIKKEDDLMKMSLRDILIRVSTSFTGILQDLSWSNGDIITIFTKDNRLIYIGLLVMMISLLIK